MIQRKQTLYLLLAAIFTGSTYFFNLWSCVYTSNPDNFPAMVSVRSFLPILLSVAASVIMALVSIFLFKNRKRQMLISIVAMATNIFVVLFGWIEINNIQKKGSAVIISQSYSLGIILPFISIVLIALAIAGIRKDEKLVTSLDRLR